MDQQKFFEFVDQNQDNFVEHLRDWVSIPSISGNVCYRDECFKMVNKVADELKALGFVVEVKDNPKKTQKTLEGQVVPLPPIILASKHLSDDFKTLGIYGHLDVQPAKMSDGWTYDPFVLTEDKGRLYGRGSTDDKGPVLGWLCMLESFRAINFEPRLNLKFCLEAMEEAGSEGLDELIEQEKETFFKDVDFVCISDNYWLGASKPCLTYGLRGIVYFQVKVSGPNQDLHSGIYGGAVHEPLGDLIHIFSKLTSANGDILIPGVLDDVAVLKDMELASYKDLDFDTEAFRKSIGVEGLRYETKEDVLMHRWRYPSLSIHGIEGAFDAPGEKTVIPRAVIGKFSIRMVPSMQVGKTTDIVTEYLRNVHASLKSSSKLEVSMSHGCPGWVTDFCNPNYESAKQAVETVFGVKPDMTREGGSIPVALSFEEKLQRSVILLPMGRYDDGAHSQNEKLDRVNFIKGIKLFGVYVENMSKL